MRFILLLVTILFGHFSFADINLDKQLNSAISARNLPLIEELIGKGANPNNTEIPSKDCFGGADFDLPPIVRAAAIEDKDSLILKYLIEHGGNINLRSKSKDCPGFNLSGRTPILHAAYFNNTEAVLFLLTAGADPNLFTLDEAKKFSVLRYAIDNRNESVIDALLNKLNLENLEFGFLSLFQNSVKEELIFKYFDRFKQLGVDLDRVYILQDGKWAISLLANSLGLESSKLFEFLMSKKMSVTISLPGLSLLTRAVYSRFSQQSVMMLLDAGASPDLRDFLAAFKGSNFTVADAILEHGVDINGKIDNAPLLFYKPDGINMIFSYFGLDQWKYLLSKGIDINQFYEGKDLILRIASGYDSGYKNGIFAELVKAGINVNSVDPKTKKTPLIQACMWVRNENNLIKELVQSGASVNALDIDGASPLYYLVLAYLHQDFSPDIVKFLIPLSSVVINKPVGEFGKTLLHAIAMDLNSLDPEKYASFLEIAHLIIENGADKSIRDKNGRVAFEYFTDENRKKYPELAELLKYP